jgi:hypothetical protein
VDAQGLLPDEVVAPTRRWLASLAADTQRRQLVVVRTLDGAITALLRSAEQVADAALGQVDALRGLEADASSAYRDAVTAVAAQSGDGTLLRGEVLSRWHDYVGTSAFVKRIDQGVAWARDRLGSLLRQSGDDEQQTQENAQASLVALVVDYGGAAAERAGQAWRANPVGRDLMAAHPELASASPGFGDAVARMLRSWQNDVLELVAEEGRGKRQGARIAATGVNVVGAALMLVIFANTGGVTGAELGVAGGTTVVAQKLLESIFGDEAVRRLAKTAKVALDNRVQALFAAELARFTEMTARLQVSDTLADELTGAIEDARTARLEQPVLGSGEPADDRGPTGRVVDGSWYRQGDADGVQYTQTIQLPPADDDDAGGPGQVDSR